MKISSRDVALARVAERRIENGAVVPPRLQVNALSLREAIARVDEYKRKWRPLDREDAISMGYAADEIIENFGEEHVPN